MMIGFPRRMRNERNLFEGYGLKALPFVRVALIVDAVRIRTLKESIER
jgi:hypothetical protein